MFLTYQGHQSSRKLLPGGGPQGAFLGGLIFIIKYNGAFLRPVIPRDSLGPILKSRSEKVKYVDDGTVAVSVNLKACLVPDPVQRAQPLTYHERTQQILPPENNLLQYYLEDTESFAIENKMQINSKKTKVISFNKSRKFDFPIEVYLSNMKHLEVIPETKLLGVIISDDLRWQKNTDYICQRAREKLWVLRRMLKVKLDLDHVFDVYTKEVGSLLELAVPVWHSGLTKLQSAPIERIQKVSFKIMLGEQYTSYDSACSRLKVKTLEERRKSLCLNFAKKDFKSDRSMFNKIGPMPNTRNKPKLVREFNCRTNRYRNSSLPYLSRLLNGSA